MLESRVASASSLVAMKPPMLTSPSFLADIVQPSPSAKKARAISSMDMAAHSGSRILQK